MRVAVRLRRIFVLTQDHQDGVFSGTNNVVQDLTGRKPLTVEQFADIDRARFAN